MKTKYIKFFIFIFAFSISNLSHGQKGIPYQALLLKPQAKIYPGVSSSTTPLTDTQVCLRFTFVDVLKNIEYQEIIKVKTDSFGLVNTIIGTGQQIDGYATSFDQIIWDSTQKRLVVELDSKGSCSTFDIINDEPFLTVPFAHVADFANAVTGIIDVANGGTGASNVVGARLNLGLSNVDNTSDVNKPISAATQTALNLKADATSVIASLALKEDTVNKTIDVATDGTSDVKFPSAKAVKTYVDTSSFFAKGLQGTTISATAPTLGQVLRFDGTNWTPKSVSSFISTGTEEFMATSNQTNFSVPANAIAILAFYINGVRVPKDAISISGGTIVYNPINNSNYSIESQDRITFDYIY